MAAEKVTDRCRRFAAALDAANIPYAVIGGNAVAAWVGSVDEEAVRNTKDVDVLLRRSDLPAVIRAAAAAGFVHSTVHADLIHVFLDGPTASVKSAVHVIFASETVAPGDPVPAPDVTESYDGFDFRVLSLEALVRMKLTANRDRDRTHLRDMLDIGLIDATWTARLPPALAARLQAILDTPEG